MRTPLAALALLTLAAPGRADVAAPPPLVNRVAPAEVVVSGRVQAILDKDVMIESSPGAMDKVAYRIAVVNITEHLLGAPGEKTVRVGFIPFDGGPGVGRPRGFTGQLKAGEEVTLLLRRHPVGDFHVAPMYWDILRADAPGYANEVKEVRHLAQRLANANTFLASKDPAERFQTAALLIVKYRTPAPGKSATQPVDAEQSKLLLKTLHDADWSGVIKGVQPNPFAVFMQLGLTPKDGWQPPANAKGLQDYVDAAREWLRRNLDTYRIQRYVSAK